MKPGNRNSCSLPEAVWIWTCHMSVGLIYGSISIITVHKSNILYWTRDAFPQRHGLDLHQRMVHSVLGLREKSHILVLNTSIRKAAEEYAGPQEKLWGALWLGIIYKPQFFYHFLPYSGKMIYRSISTKSWHFPVQVRKTGRESQFFLPSLQTICTRTGRGLMHP